MSKKKKILQEQTRLPDTDYLWGESLDAAFMVAMLDRINQPIRNLPSFKMGLIDGAGNVIKEPKTKEERRALTMLDQVVLFMRKSMGGRTILLNNMYRRNRMRPEFIRASARARSLRFLKYYDLKIGFFEKPITQPTHLGIDDQMPQGR
jgi:hypothetical protein